jgi:methylated-DNA-protein-cysteine methyltransferase-like protein
LQILFQNSNSAMNRDKNDFFEDVYAVVRLIPYGRVTSYGAIARYLGTGRSSRMVGWAMNNSHGLEIPAPAHRVVNRLGLLTGKAHFGDEKAMQRLLQAEGVRVEHDRVVDFEQLYWDPLREIQY